MTEAILMDIPRLATGLKSHKLRDLIRNVWLTGYAYATANCNSRQGKRGEGVASEVIPAQCHTLKHPHACMSLFGLGSQKGLQQCLVIHFQKSAPSTRQSRTDRQ